MEDIIWSKKEKEVARQALSIFLAVQSTSSVLDANEVPRVRVILSGSKRVTLFIPLMLFDALRGNTSPDPRS